MYEKRSRLKNIVVGAVIIGATFAGLHYGQKYMHNRIENHLENNPRLNRVIEVLSYPTKELQKFVHGQSEEEYRRNEQEYGNNIDKIVNGSETE